MDPEGEQEQEDNQEGLIKQQEEFDHADLEFVQQATDDAFEKSYRPIKVSPLEVLRQEGHCINFYQRKRLEITFGFTFGIKHYSLSEKTRDTKRAMFKNQSFLIIVEVSMVKADQLYLINLRLREVTMQPDKLFGGVSICVFGDIMQLKPVKGRVIWSQPKSSEY